MQLAALKRWHWVVLALLAGFAVAWARQAAQGELTGVWVDDFGYRLSDRARFEQALGEQLQGNRLFKDITVYPRWVQDAQGRRTLVHVVAGRYWGGRPEVVNGTAQAVWRPTCFIAPVPYVPATDLSIYNKPGGENYAKRFQDAGPNATVLDFLSVMGRAAGVSYRYAWWDAHPYLAWVGGSLLLVGGVWPTVINLLVFSSLTRPPEAKAMSLWGVKGTTTAPRPGAVLAHHPAPDELDAELEAALHGNPSAGDTEPAPAAVPVLSTTPLDPVAPLDTGPAKEFGAKEEDFYPTERRAGRRNGAPPPNPQRK